MRLENEKSLNNILGEKMRPWHPATDLRGFSLFGGLIEIGVKVPIIDLCDDSEEDRLKIAKIIGAQNFPATGVSIDVEEKVVSFRDTKTRDRAVKILEKKRTRGLSK
jgi:hypothetical protein